jgi:hypothetical protein
MGSNRLDSRTSTAWDLGGVWLLRSISISIVIRLIRSANAQDLLPA